MKYVTCLFFLVSVVLFSCEEEKKIVVPADLIPREKFVEVLADVRLLEGAYATRYSRVDSAAYGIDSYYQRLFENHGITREAFRHSYEFFAMDQEKMLAIEEEVITRVTSLEATQDSVGVK